MSYIKQEWREDASVQKIETDGIRMFVKKNALLGAELIEPSEGKTKRFTARIPEVVEVIMESAFESLPIVGVLFPHGLNYIGKRAFMRTPLKEVSFPSTLELIDDSAFQSCKQLRKVIFPESLKFLGEKSFAHDWNLGECEYGGEKKQWFKLYRSPIWNYSSYHIVILCQDGDKIDYTIDYDGFISFEKEWYKKPSEKRVAPEQQDEKGEGEVVTMTMGQILANKNALIIHPLDERPTPVVYVDSVSGIKALLDTDYLIRVSKFRLVLQTPPDGVSNEYVLFSKYRLDNEPVLPSVHGKYYPIYYGTVCIAGYDKENDTPRAMTDAETLFVAENMAYTITGDNVRSLMLVGYESLDDEYIR